MYLWSPLIAFSAFPFSRLVASFDRSTAAKGHDGLAP
ncbi:hypothetical protein F11_07455 [Rhodospirillum rubrum F11]|nr:hypothetical protein F11_07455 [Rhodospirillum rubrum F11]